MDYRTLLNDEQYAGVTCNSQYTRVVAGAGSGKTRVLTYRISYLLEEMGVSPYSIIALTFTNKAAKEIKERVVSICGDVSGLFLGTIHSWCARFLRFEAEHIGYPRNFTILDEDDQLGIMKYIFSELHHLPKTDANIKKCLEWIGNKKMRGLEYEDIKNDEYPDSTLKDFKVYFREYTEILYERHSFDFDDLLLKTIDILEDKDNGVRERYMRGISHILIDEFQDINDVQFKLISLLMNRETSLYVVGDPDQTIYTWRGANHHLIMDLEENVNYIYKGAKVNTIILDRNYRSTKTILSSSNKLIACNKERVQKALYSLGDEGTPIRVFNARTQREESTHVVTSIIDLHKQKKVNYKDIAVLYRANYLTRDLETVLGMYRIPYRIFGGMKFYQRREIKDIISYFRLIVNPADDTAFLRIINVPKKNIGPAAEQKIIDEAKKIGQTLFLYVKENINSSPLTLKQRVGWINIIEQMKIVNNEIELDNRSLSNVLENFITNIGYFAYLKEEDDNADERIENVKELISYVDGFLKENPTMHFDDFVNNAMLQSAQDDVSTGDYVSLMTVHTAKGLEFDNVFIYGFCDGVFPSERSISESKTGLEEERRLAYVAMTRAKKELSISSNQDYSYVMQCPLQPSRFIKEAGLETKKTDFRSLYNSSSQTIYKPAGFIKKDISAKQIALSSETNGITDWKVGDIVIHTTYGRGKVVEVIDKLIVVQFDGIEGKKTLLGNHISIKKGDNNNG